MATLSARVSRPPVYTGVRSSLAAVRQRGPAVENGAHREPGAYRGHEHEISVLQAALVERATQRERDGGRGRVAVARDVLHHLALGQAHPLAHRVDDSDVRLVGHEE